MLRWNRLRPCPDFEVIECDGGNQINSRDLKTKRSNEFFLLGANLATICFVNYLSGSVLSLILTLIGILKQMTYFPCWLVRYVNIDKKL